jgi:phospholipid transport system substrate-binding protein
MGSIGLFGGIMARTTNRQFTRREFAALLAGIVASGHAGAARAALNPAENYVDRIAGEVMGLANGPARGDALKSKFAGVLNRYINLRSIANFALGPYQKKLPQGEREEFYRLFSNYAAALFVYYVEDFRGSGLDIISNSQQGKFTTITSAIKLKAGGREQVKWRLVQTGGGYKISDINIKGVWLTIATKKRFSDVLNRSKGDFGVLFAELKEAETW